LASRLCRSDDWPSDVDSLAALYNDELSCLLDRILSMRQFIRRQRPSDPWFDAECRNAKRRSRRLERAYAAANRRAASTTLVSKPSIAAAATISKAATAKAAWYAQRRAYRQLRHRKLTDFWRDKVASNESDPRQLLSIIEDLLGRG